MASRRVLVVEDEWLIASDYQMMLTRAGHVVVGPAATSASALALLRSEPVDMALLDFQLSEETSVEVAKCLNQAGVPFIIVTGHTEIDLPAPFSSGLLLSKPVNPATLLDCVDRLARRSAT